MAKKVALLATLALIASILTAPAHSASLGVATFRLAMAALLMMTLPGVVKEWIEDFVDGF